MKREKNFEMITAEYFPSITREQIVESNSFRISIDELMGLGSAFSIVGAEISKALMNSGNMEGLYRCVFPEGVTGKLAKFIDEPKYNIGTIVNKNGIAGQARWEPVKSQSLAMSFDPISIAIAVVILNINMKMEEIQQTTQEILRFLQQDKESDLEASVNLLADILDHYRFNSDNNLWKGSQLTVVTTIKGKAEQSIIFYRKQVKRIFKDFGVLHVNQQVNKTLRNVQHNFKYYQLGVYLYAYASFLEVVLNGNYQKDYLEHIFEKLMEYSQQYKIDYTEIYNQLESFTKTSVETIALKGIGKASKGIGTAIARIPVVSKGPVDEAMIAVGNSAKKLSKRHSENTMRIFRNNRDAGIQMFMENIEAVNRISNKPVEMLIDKDAVYICPCELNNKLKNK